ncbi:O-antigen ligase family protein [Frigidibacter sp. SD6-1]|uniref:O-antigen ligase family protein n=2 Tax=Frigidibacter sp. SD6-1 TaxID=3032581 RepID=UPI0024DFB44F|nr:O-antigen ligase family protein [Frigidibacter sp. SD6-1]
MSPVVWLYLICVITPVAFNIGSVAMTPLRLLLLIMVLPLSARLFSGEFGRVLAVDILFFVHILWATIAIAVNNPNRVVENVGSAAVEFLGGYLVARAYIRTPDQFEKLIKALVLLIIVLLPFGLPELKTGKPVIPTLIEALPGIGSVEDIDNPKRMGLERVQNVFAHPIHYGLFCSVAFTLLLLGFHGRLSLFKRAIGCAIIFAGVFISLSSGALLAVLLQVGLLTWALALWRVPRKWLILLGLMALGYVTIDLLSNRTPMKVIMSYATFSAQTAYYRAEINSWGMYNVQQNPIFGLGLRNWIRPGYMQRGSVDNFWLVMAMRYGIPGFLILAIGYFHGLFKVGLANLDFSDRALRLRLAWMITFCGLSFTLTTVHVWTAMYSFVFFIFGAGMCMIGWRPEDFGSDEAATARTEAARPGLAYSRRHAKPAEAQPRGGPAYTREPSASGPKSSRDGTATVYSRFGAGGPDARPRYRREADEE